MPHDARFARPLAAALALVVLSGGAFGQMRGEQPQQADPPAGVELPPDASRFQPIHVAAMKADIPAIQSELDAGVPVDLRIERGFFAGVTALMMAARDGDVLTMNYLLDKGADVNARDDRRVSVLMWASGSAGSVEKIQAALARGAEVNPRSQDGATALHWATGLGRDPDMVKALIDAGAAIDLPDNRGRTPLMTAARVGNTGGVKYLLDAGADRGRKSPHGLNALHWAAEGRESNAATIRALVEAGAAVDSRAADGSTPLIIAALNGRAEQMAELIAMGADPDATNSWGLTALMAAASEGSPEAMKAILDADPDLNARDQAGRVALHYSVAEGHGIATAMLCRRNPETDVADNEGWKPIHIARTMATLDPLVRAGADVDAPCGVAQYKGWTPLMFAAGTGNTFLARRLLNADADPMIETDKAANAMRVAMAVQYPEGGNPMADLIRDAIAVRQVDIEAQRYRERHLETSGPAPQQQN